LILPKSLVNDLVLSRVIYCYIHEHRTIKLEEIG